MFYILKHPIASRDHAHKILLQRSIEPSLSCQVLDPHMIINGMHYSTISMKTKFII